MTDTERAAMIRLAGQWETAADNLEAAITNGAGRHLLTATLCEEDRVSVG